MKPKLISATQATIRTASIEIKTLTVRDKQVTLALFRQLPAARLITDQGTLAGVPWGIVRYDIKIASRSRSTLYCGLTYEIPSRRVLRQG